MKYTTRIAPSPTGPFHLGTARTAYHSWLAARSSGGKFILRIDDTDPVRSEQQYIDLIFESMEWLGLDWDESFQQSKRRGRYEEVLAQLLRDGKAKPASDDELHPITLYNPQLPPTWDDIKGPVNISAQGVMSAVDMKLTRADGSPLYHLASVVDDIDYGVNYIIRGADHLANTPRQIALFNAIGSKIPKFAHVGLIHKDKKKMSKRNADCHLGHYRKYHPEAILNFVLRLGWGPRRDDQSAALLPKEEAVKLFLEGGKLRAAAANYDAAKLKWYDRMYTSGRAARKVRC